MKVLVTGGAGYIGAHVVRALAASGHDPVILDDLRRSRRHRAGSFPLEETALEDSDAVVAVLERHRPEAVVHLAGLISVGESAREPTLYWENNLGAGASLLLALARVPVRRFVFSSTAAVYGESKVIPIPETAPLEPSSPYGASKLAFEQLLHRSAGALGLHATALRYFNASGAGADWGVGEEHEPEEHLIPRVIRALRAGTTVQVYGDDYPTPDGTCERDYIHVQDLAMAHVRVLESQTLPGGGSFNVGTGCGHSVLEVIRAIAKVLGITPDIEQLPRRPGDPPRLIAAPDRLREVLHWEPQHSSLEEIVASAIDWELRRSGESR